MLGFKGEDITDERVWFIKTHFPMQQWVDRDPFHLQKCIIIFRNPLDSAPSLLSLIVSTCMNLRVKGNEEKMETA